MPAAFGADDPLARIEISPRDLTRGKTEIAIGCQTFVETSGALTDYVCWPPNISEDQKVAQIVVRSLADITFAPAQVNGIATRVLMNFRLSIRCADEGCTIESTPNHGYHEDELGADYVAPQPILPGAAWYDGFEDKLEWLRAYMPSFSFRFNQTNWPMRPAVRVAVDEDGVAARGCISSMRLMGDDEAERNRQKLDQMLASIGATSFIPGFVDGRPVAMTFIENTVMQNYALLVSKPNRLVPFAAYKNRYFTRALASRTEAPELYCAN